MSRAVISLTDAKEMIADMFIERLTAIIDHPQLAEARATFEREKSARMCAKFDQEDAPPKRRTTAAYIAAQLELGCRLFTRQECASAGIQTSSPHFLSVYSNSAYQIADLLRDDKMELIRAILDLRVPAGRVATCDILTYCPSVLRAERDEIALRKSQKIELKTSTSYVCKKCGSHETIYFEVQTRSSDEAPTLMIQCVNCQHRWNQSG